ncbi:AbrB/MazE/SpoVT family DNA-binding domain-containing protein [Sphingomonas sp. RHCKR7]|uniref:AbrB/MazE/SpoVT family DNA-binding domain-containing protein n=1 Tax=Sphingomonas folli TaxID=2862497 RepID=UPI001CA4A1AB|nr:AbrB/MazE/SpoVT family DNA-binding domain-containing protein [Sphingomonas folli]MBW6525355.1 AbrB/MazE/SpoVT family DNA-binding domain-containing protein [Sphingomonas folli]
MPAPLEKRTRTNMTSKGQVLIPKDVRDQIGLVPGAPVDVGVNDRGEAVVVPSGATSTETAEERTQRLDRLFASVDADPLFDRTGDEILRDVRGDERLP